MDTLTRKLIVTCEHASNLVPARYAELRIPGAVLATHRAYDIGAMGLYRVLRQGAAYGQVGRATRLIVDLNRSRHNTRGLFSEYTRSLDSEGRAAVLRDLYDPYREKLNRALQEMPAPFLHVAVHSFVKHFGGRVRNFDVGLLYDPRHGEERSLALFWRRCLARKMPGLRVRMNQPYSGRADGLSRALRESFGADYNGIELEVNQSLLEKERDSHALAHALRATLAELVRA